ncbi:MAG: IS21 family transposase [Rhodothermales bacterium]|nr:IS21 family transposase [Rhodothermales bacterium]
MSNVLKPEKREQICALGRLGWSLRRIEEATGVRRETVSGYLKEAGIAVRGHRQRRLEVTAKPASQVTTDSDPGSKPASQVTADLERSPAGDFSPRASACEPHRELIERQVDLGRTAKSIWEDLVDDHGFGSSYECVKRFVRKLRGPSFAVAHPRIFSEPGQEAQVDYGDGPMVRDDSGRYRRTRLFALTLGCSRKSVWLLAFRSSTKTWCQLHEKAFRRLGGTTATIILDNLREGVVRPDIYDPEVNPLYRAMLEHYGIVALPAKVGDPDRKGKVESAIGYAEKKLRGLRFESLEDAQAYLDRWTERWADTRIHGTTKRQVAAMFAEEKPALRPLPNEPFRYFEYGRRVVHRDGCVEVARAYYSAAPGWIGWEVPVQWDDMYVRILNPRTGELYREHVRQRPGRHRIHKDDESPRRPPAARDLLRRAHNSGERTGKVCERILSQCGQTGIRSVLGVLSLVKRFGRDVVDRACSVALECDYPTYRFVRRYIDHMPPEGPELRQVDELIRDLTHYRNFVDRKTGNLFS